MFFSYESRSDESSENRGCLCIGVDPRIGARGAGPPSPCSVALSDAADAGHSAPRCSLCSPAGPADVSDADVARRLSRTRLSRSREVTSTGHPADSRTWTHRSPSARSCVDSRSTAAPAASTRRKVKKRFCFMPSSSITQSRTSTFPRGCPRLTTSDLNWYSVLPTSEKKRRSWAARSVPPEGRLSPAARRPSGLTHPRTPW